MTAWRTFAQLTWARRRLLVEAVLCLAVARLAVVAMPFRKLSRRLGAHGRESSTDIHAPPTLRIVADIVWALEAASRRLPWRCACIEQGIAAKMMLSRRSIASTLYLGVARVDEGEGRAAAHAWLRSGPFVVTGAAGHDRYTVVSTFADEA
jgi:transglutaminase superfamily protein